MRKNRFSNEQIVAALREAHHLVGIAAKKNKVSEQTVYS